jgi:hypothetical protein
MMSRTPLQREWERLLKLFYDGTFPVERYLHRFDYRVKRIKQLDPDVLDGEIVWTMYSQLVNAERLPALGLDGEQYEGPETWLERQAENDIDEYEKLKSALRERYGEKKSSLDVLKELGDLQPNWNFITLKEFFNQVQDIVGTTRVEDGFIITVVNSKLPEDLKYQLRRMHFRWMHLKFSEYRIHCEDIYDDMQYSDDSLSNDYYDTLDYESSTRRLAMIAEIEDLKQQLAIVNQRNKQWAEIEALRQEMPAQNLPLPNENDICHDPVEVDIVTFSQQPVLTKGGETAVDTRKDSTEYGFEVGYEPIDDDDIPLDEADIPHDPPKVNIVMLSEQPVLSAEDKTMVTIQVDCTTDHVEVGSENTDRDDKCDIDTHSGGSIETHELDDLLALPDVPGRVSADGTVQGDVGPAHSDNDDVLAEIDSGCVVSLSMDTAIVVEKVHPMARSMVQQWNHTARLRLHETRTISKISDTNYDYSMVRHNCKSTVYDIASHTIPWNDPHHDWGIEQSLVVIRRPTFGRGPDAIVPSLVFPFSDMEVSNIGIQRHECWDPGGQKTQTTKSTSTTECVGTSWNISFLSFVSNLAVYDWDPGGQKKMEIDSTKTSKFVAIGDGDIYTIFRLPSSVYFWDPGGYHIDFRLSVKKQGSSTPSGNEQAYEGLAYRQSPSLRSARGFRRARRAGRLRKPLKGVGVTGCVLRARVKGLKSRA